MHQSLSGRSLALRRNPVSPRATVIAALAISLFSSTTSAHAQARPGLLASRAELSAAVSRIEGSAEKGDASTRAQNAMVAASIRERLRDGDFQVGDRVIVTIVSDAVHRDTAVVRSERTLQLLGGTITVPVAGVLRSELQERVSAEVLKYVKAQRIETTPLMRVGVLGSVTRPGYFAFASDVPISDAIMGAGGPTATADLGRSIVRRGNQEYRSAAETSKAIAQGLTLDQFGLSAGDELVIGERRQRGAYMLLGMTGALASVLTLFVALNR